MNFNYTRLTSIFITNKKPLTKTWRYKQRKDILQKYSLFQVYEQQLYSDVHAVRKALCLEQLLKFIENQRQFLVKQYYTIVLETYKIFPMDIQKKICSYIRVPIKINF